MAANATFAEFVEQGACACLFQWLLVVRIRAREKEVAGLLFANGDSLGWKASTYTHTCMSTVN